MNYNYYKLFRSFFLILLIFEVAGLLGLTEFDPRLGLADIRSQFSWLGLLLTLLASWGALEIVHYYFRNNHNVPTPFYLWAAVAFAVLFDVVADVNHFFSRFEYFDNLAHFLNGGIIVGLSMLWTVRQINDRYSYFWPKSVILCLVIITATFIGFVYEVLEYSIDWSLGTNNLTSRWDTSEDMIFNFSGAVLLTVPFLLGIL